MKLFKWLGVTLFGLSTSVVAQFCPLPQAMPSEQEQDQLFINAMFEAEYVFRGRLFTFYDDKCDGEICAFDGLVFKVLENIKGFSNPYVEGGWIEDCERLWLHPMQWRTNKDKMMFNVDQEYLILAVDTPRGIYAIGSREVLKGTELMMRYELARISRK